MAFAKFGHVYHLLFSEQPCPSVTKLMFIPFPFLSFFLSMKDNQNYSVQGRSKRSGWSGFGFWPDHFSEDDK